MLKRNDLFWFFPAKKKKEKRKKYGYSVNMPALLGSYFHSEGSLPVFL